MWPDLSFFNQVKFWHFEKKGVFEIDKCLKCAVEKSSYYWAFNLCPLHALILPSSFSKLALPSIPRLMYLVRPHLLPGSFSAVLSSTTATVNVVPSAVFWILDYSWHWSPMIFYGGKIKILHLTGLKKFCFKSRVQRTSFYRIEITACTYLQQKWKSISRNQKFKIWSLPSNNRYIRESHFPRKLRV